MCILWSDSLCLWLLCKCWGYSGNGRLGIGTTENMGDDPDEMGSNLPELSFPQDFVPVFLSAGYDTTCAVSESHVCKCWGSGANAILAQGNTDDSDTPSDYVSLGGAFDVDFVSVGYGSACAVSTVGEMKVYLYVFRKCILSSDSLLSVLGRWRVRATGLWGHRRFGRRCE